jgi:hypothetical protein
MTCRSNDPITWDNHLIREESLKVSVSAVDELFDRGGSKTGRKYFCHDVPALQYCQFGDNQHEDERTPPHDALVWPV